LSQLPPAPGPGTRRRKKAVARARAASPEAMEKVRAAKLAKKTQFDAREVARNLITDPDYQEKLRERLLEGSLGNLEIWLWRYAGGDPKPDDAEMEAQKKRFEELRGRLQQLLRESPEKARILEAEVVGKKTLPLPKALEVTVFPPDGSSPKSTGS